MQTTLSVLDREFISVCIDTVICLGAMDDDIVLREMVKKALEGKGVLAQIRVR